MQRLQRMAGHLISQEKKKFKVAVMGAAGGIGQPLSLLLKAFPNISELSLYDVFNTPGVACDLSHISTGAKVKGYLGPDQLPQALSGVDLVVIPAGVPRKPGMTRDDLFNINAGIVQGLCEAIAVHCPTAWVAIISNPVNSTVPIAVEVFRKAGLANEGRVFGVTTLDVVRAETFLAEALGLSEPRDVKIPVVGGHAGITILPLISQMKPQPAEVGKSLSESEIQRLTRRIQEAGTEVVEAKAGAGSATLSMAFAAARFADSCLRAMGGATDVIECAFVSTAAGCAEGARLAAAGHAYFSSPLVLSKNGVVRALPLGTLSASETAALENMTTELKSSTAKGTSFVREEKAKALAAVLGFI
eukprot:CAMPEP_0175066648 /NCGR_PEP_ID=MMETSP0052_2-20121109/16636_1 /TAXON_ID=51329 ORGANISM="Polytomella parva, Strain SAG 63-3" /NCGR_SAMPLE_ID=MMETSP0052_2 /ASSEMBLY_ACC=CAM_ASM_000194 /LENGTH=359 /DNA_ID=CAMNT_0016333395 /DNA_START=129 /DNA_END=1208 /DNA_ORIENTATION=-